MTPASYLKPTSGGVLLTLKVQPRSSKTQVIGPQGEFLKIRLKAAPVEGAANEEVLDLLQKMFRVPRQNIQIVRGQKSRIKKVEIKGLSYALAEAAVLTPHKS